MNNTEDAHSRILDDIEANPSRYEIRQLLGDKILRIDSSDGSMWLCRNDGGTRRLITLVEHGEVKFLTEADIDKAVKEAEEFAEQDKKRKELVEMKNQCEQLILAIDKTVMESADKLSDEDKETLKNAAKDAKEKLDKAEDVEAVKAITEELGKTTNPIFTKLYQDMQAQQAGQSDAGSDDGSTINVNPDDIQ